MVRGLGIVAFLVFIWAASTYSQYRYWGKVRRMIHDLARDHIGCLGTGLCRISFARNVFVVILTDSDGIVTNCLELAGLSLTPRFAEIRGTAGVPVEELYDHMPSPRYRDAFQQALAAIDRSRGDGRIAAAKDG